jgi:hypothetical protein
MATPAPLIGEVYHFRPYNVGRWLVWGLFALVLLLAPRLWTSGFAHTMLSQMGIAIIVCLSATRCTAASDRSWPSIR